MLDHASFMAAGKKLGEAGKAAQQALTQARKLGLFRLQLEASLTLGQIEMQAEHPASARARLQALEKNARAKGFELIARKAANANALPQGSLIGAPQGLGSTRTAPHATFVH
jgi:hypothetical protein